MTPEQWDEAADYLDECNYCGKVHVVQKLPGNQITWADPVDGHSYYRRGRDANLLRLKATELRAEVQS